MEKRTKDENLLMKFDTDWWNNACVNYSNSPWHLYASGYYAALEVLIDHILNNSAAKIDTLIYPVIYLYHQYLELRLKEIIIIGNKFLDKPNEISPIHDLTQLWKTARSLIQEIEPAGPKTDLDKMEEIIKKFSSIDPKSMTFRYPVKIDGSPALNPDITYINIRHFASMMEGVISNLEGISIMISEYQNYKNDECETYFSENLESQDRFYQ
jgi:hypothetical protein